MILSNPRDLPILAIQNYLQDTLTKYFAWNVTVGMKHSTAAAKPGLEITGSVKLGTNLKIVIVR